MFKNIGKIGKEVAASSLALMEARDYLLMSSEEKQKYLRDKSVARRLTTDELDNNQKIHERYGSEPDVRIADSNKRENQEFKTDRQLDRDGRDIRDQRDPPAVETLKPCDVITWISSFDGTGNVRVFIREVDDALNEMPTWQTQKDLLRRVLANRLTGRAKDLVNAQETNTWPEIVDLLVNYFDIRDAPYNYLKEQRNKIIQGVGENVQEYARRFLDAHNKVMRAAGSKADLQRAKFAQEMEEEEGVWRFVVGLADKLNERVEGRCPRSLKEAINVALNVESKLQERYLCRRLAQLRVEEKGHRRDGPQYRDERRRDGPQHRDERCRDGLQYRDERRRDHVYYRDDARARSDRSRRTVDDAARAGSSEARRPCYVCNKGGHVARDCPQRQAERQNFRSQREQDRPPPVRMIEEEEEDRSPGAIEEEEEGGNNHDPYGYIQQERANRSSSSDREESTELYGY